MEPVEIKIKCQGAALMDIEDMREFQGSLKSLSIGDFEKLKGHILENGYSFTIHIWKEGEHNYILDGHQRHRVLLKMREYGYIIPPVPISIVEADSYKQARLKLLGAASQFGRVEGAGLYEFSTIGELDIEEIMAKMSLRDLDLDQYKKEFLDNISLGEIDPKDPDSIGQYDPDKDTYSVRINDVKTEDKEDLLEALNKWLESSGYQYSAGAY